MTSTTTPAHVRTAANKGMKAGFRQFAAASSKSGLDTVQQLWSRFEDRNNKAQFQLYCAMFGPTVESLTGDTIAKHTPVVVEQEASDIQALIEAAVAAAVAQVLGTTTPKATTRKRTSKPNLVTAEPKATKKAAPKASDEDNSFSAKTVAYLGLPTKVGATFTYKSKRGKSRWIVTGSKAGAITAARV